MALPTHDEEAEKSVLGAVLRDGDVIPSVLEKMKTSDFYKPRHQTILEAAVTLFSRSDPVDPTTVASELRQQGNLQRVGGAPYLFELIQAPGVSTNATYYARVVSQAAQMRRLDDLCTRGRQLVSQGGSDYQEVMDQFQRFMDESELLDAPKVEGFNDLFQQWVHWQDEKEFSIPTPWHLLNDKLAGGLQRQRLYIVAARPGCGKSVMGLNISSHTGVCGYTSMVFSLEMPKMEVMSRMLAAGAHADYGQLMQRSMDSDNFEKINRFVAQHPDFNERVKIDDGVDHTIESIAQQARAQKRKGLDVVFIDYVQLLNSSGRSESRYQELGVMSKMAKQMARKLDVAVVIAAQLNRAPEQQHRLPQLSDLRESGNLEADADAVLMLSRGQDEHMPQMPLITVTIAKNRTGQAPDTVLLPEHFDQARIGA